jgi:hypothetical protein
MDEEISESIIDRAGSRIHKINLIARGEGEVWPETACFAG